MNLLYKLLAASVLFLAISCSHVEKSSEIYDSADLADLYDEIGITPVPYEEDSIPQVSDSEESISEQDPEIQQQVVEVNEKDSIVNSSATKNVQYSRVAVNHVGSLMEVFNDSNHHQMVYAKKYGIEPIRTIADTWHTRRPLVKITTNRNYRVDKLTHSLPFLVPEAALLLNDIGKSFIDTLKNRGAEGYRIIATSLLRTPHSVKKLRRVNVNATENSTHQFGTTFDISWSRFDSRDKSHALNEVDLKHLLAEVLYDMKKQGRCMVKYERKTACFHVTVTK